MAVGGCPGAKALKVESPMAPGKRRDECRDVGLWPGGQSCVEQPACGVVCLLLISLGQLGKVRFVLAALGTAEGFPAGVSRHMSGCFVKLLKDLGLRREAQCAFVVVEQHLDADGAFDQRQLAVEQAAGQHPQVVTQALVLRAANFSLLALFGPDLAPEMNGVECKSNDEQYRDSDQSLIKPHGTS